MSEFETLADLFPPDRQPTRELEPIQKVDQIQQIERDIEEFHETHSARRVLAETAKIVAGGGLAHRFRYVHATFGSGKSHLLKLIGVATGEIEGLEEYAHELANTKSGFKQFREALSESRIDHLQPLFMNLLDRDREDSSLPIMLFEELGRRRGYPTSRTWLLELCWRLDVEHDLWDHLSIHEHEGLTLQDVVDRPSSLRPWLTASIPNLEGADAAGLGTATAVKAAIERSESAVADETFGPYDLVDRLNRTKRHLERNGEVYQFLIGLDEIAIYVGDQARRYQEVVDTITALIDGLNPPILGTGQWSMRDMQQNFVGDVDEDEWYAQEIQLEGADTETIVRKRWLQKSHEGATYIESELLSDAPAIEPVLDDDYDATSQGDPVEAYPFRDRDLHLLRATMQGLIKGERETDREYIQGRALLVRVRSLFADHGWAGSEPGVIVPWDTIYDIIKADTALIPSWASDLIDRVGNTLDDPLATRAAKALFLVSQVEFVPRTENNLARLLADNVQNDLDRLEAKVEEQLEALDEYNLIRADAEATPTTYTILSERDIRFWQEVQKEATEMPEHQLRDNVQQFLQEADPDRLTPHDGDTTRTFAEVEDVTYSIRYTIDRPVPDSVTDKYDRIVVRLLANDEQTLRNLRQQWQEENIGPDGREDVLVAVPLTEAIRQQIRQLVGMRIVLSGMADPRPEYRLQRQTLQEEIEDAIRDRLNGAEVFTPTRQSAYGPYLESFDEVVAEAVDEKFPKRKTIDRPLQLDDLEALLDFFNGEASWPFTEEDADVLGVKTVPRTIDDGWATEFLEVFSDDDRVSGEQVLETIEGRRGAFLGTPPESLHTLLFVLVAANRIEIRLDGERVTDNHSIARIITRRTQFENAVVGFDPEPPAEGLDDVYEALLGESPDTEDTGVLVEELTEWAEANGSRIRTVVSKTNLEFESTYTLNHLGTALEPAFSGNELDADRLTSSVVAEEASLYRKVAPLFIPTEEGEEPLWEQFKSTYQTLSELYPTAKLVSQMQAYAMGSQVPTKSTLEDQLERAHDYRVTQLQELCSHLTGTSPESDELNPLREELTAALGEERLNEEIEEVEDRFEQVSLDALRSVRDQAGSATEPLAEETLADESLHQDAETLANGRALLGADEDGVLLFERLSEIDATLSGTHDSFVVNQIQRAVSGKDIPSVDRARQLLAQGERLKAGEEPDEEMDNVLQELWMRIADRDEGTIVLIDTEGDR